MFAIDARLPLLYFLFLAHQREFLRANTMQQLTNVITNIDILEILLFLERIFTARKGFWHELLGIGNFYYDLGLQILKIGLVARDKYGGTIYMDDLISQITRARRDPEDSITELSMRTLGVWPNVYIYNFKLLKRPHSTLFFFFLYVCNGQVGHYVQSKVT